jgi:hypothetical protein
MPSIETIFGIFFILTFPWSIIVMDNWKLDAKSLSKWIYMQHCKSIMIFLFFFTRNDK